MGDQVTETTEHQPALPTAAGAAGRQVTFPWSLAIGAAAAIVGLLPWIITGMRLPLQNLWATVVASHSMPIALLPLNQYAITLIAGMIVTGAALAGLLARTLQGRLSRRGPLGIALGVFLVQVSAAVQATLIVAAGLRDGTESAIYLTAMTAVVVLSIGFGALSLILIGRAPRAGALLGIAMSAIAVGVWLNGLIVPFGALPNDMSRWFLGVARWVPAILIGVAVAWCGVRTVWRAVAAVASLLILWLMPATITAVSAAVGSRVLARRPDQMLEFGVQVFQSALLLPEVSLVYLLVAIVTAAAGLVLRRLMQAREAGPTDLPSDR